MAVRRRLLQMFQEPQFGGAIMVERSRPETRRWRQEQERTKALEDSGGSSGGDSSALQGQSQELEDGVLYQCQRCHTVLGDSLHLCAQEEKLGLMACFSEWQGRRLRGSPRAEDTSFAIPQNSSSAFGGLQNIR